MYEIERGLLERLYELLDFAGNEEIVSAYAEGELSYLHVNYITKDSDDEDPTEYIADMSDRPTALLYAMGLRSSYND